MTRGELVADLAMQEVGKPYTWGAEGPVTTRLKRYDCSELAQNVYGRAGITEIINAAGKKTPIGAFDPSWRQHKAMFQIDVCQALRRVGSLVFCWSPFRGIYHVGISLGDGRIVEARGEKWGVIMSGWRKQFNRGGWTAALDEQVGDHG